MKFFINTSQRSEEKEIMDDFSLEGKQLRDTLNKLEIINRTLGGNRVTIKGLQTIMKNEPKEKQFTILDLGCGHGDILRDVAKFGKKHKYQFKLIGIDANQDAINYANELSEEYPELSFQKMDIFSEEFSKLSYDVVLCTLFAHHFKDDELQSFLKKVLNKAKLGIVVNDLQRNKLAYYLFMFISLFANNKMIREDGLTSIRRAFKRKDLENITKNIEAKASIRWKWAFRYLWILQKA